MDDILLNESAVQSQQTQSRQMGGKREKSRRRVVAMKRIRQRERRFDRQRSKTGLRNASGRLS